MFDVKHSFQSTKGDPADSGLVGATKWNAAHAGRHPAVYMFRTGDSANDPTVTPAVWVVFKPDGSQLSTGGTTTQGLQEAINYACQNGYDLIVNGGGVKTAGIDVAIIHCTSPIVFPPMQNKNIYFGAVSVVIDGAHAAATVFNSCMMVNVDFNGQLISSGSGICLQFNPTTQLPLDPVTAITASQFRFKTIGTNGGTTPRCIQFNVGNNAILSNRFEFGETNSFGIAGSTGIQVSDAAASKTFRENSIFCYNLHGQRVSGVQIGTTAGDRLGGNFWDIFQFADQGALGSAFLTWGQEDIIRLAMHADSDTVTDAIKLEAAAAKNVFLVSRWPAVVTTRFNDASTLKSSAVISGNEFVSVHKNGSDQGGIVTATWTKVTWPTELRDSVGAFASDRWTPGMVGIGVISARAGWTVGSDTALAGIAIYKNGVIHKVDYSNFSGTGGGQGPEITAMVTIDAVTDFFEIFARQESGTDKIISGAATDTWAMMKRL